MAEEIEIPTEHLQEKMDEAAEREGEPWLLRVALTAALLSACAAIAATLAGHYVNEATLEQIRASDTWTQYQAKSIKALMLRSKFEVLEAIGKPRNPEDTAKIDEYTRDSKELESRARESDDASSRALARHEIFARSVTAFQIAISICAISALTRSRWLWYASMAGGVMSFLVMGRGLV